MGRKLRSMEVDNAEQQWQCDCDCDCDCDLEPPVPSTENPREVGSIDRDDDSYLWISVSDPESGDLLEGWVGLHPREKARAAQMQHAHAHGGDAATVFFLKKIAQSIHLTSEQKHFLGKSDGSDGDGAAMAMEQNLGEWIDEVFRNRCINTDTDDYRAGYQYLRAKLTSLPLHEWVTSPQDQEVQQLLWWWHNLAEAAHQTAAGVVDTFCPVCWRLSRTQANGLCDYHDLNRKEYERLRKRAQRVLGEGYQSYATAIGSSLLDDTAVALGARRRGGWAWIQQQAEAQDQEEGDTSKKPWRALMAMHRYRYVDLPVSTPKGSARARVGKALGESDNKLRPHGPLYQTAHDLGLIDTMMWLAPGLRERRLLQAALRWETVRMLLEPAPSRRDDDLRTQVSAGLAEGLSQSEIARRLGLSRQRVSVLVKELRSPS